MENISNKIFLIEDDESFGGVLKSYLEINDYQVNWQKNGLNALENFEKDKYALCIVDVMLPGLDGFSVAQKIKEKQKNIPLIFLTAKTLREDVLRGYKTGADDYITKPFDSEVLLYKIRAVLKRNLKSGQTKNEVYKIGNYQFNHPLRFIQLGDKKQKLSPKEADLLKMLCEKQNEILARSAALLNIWGEENYFTTRSMDVYITKLRKYLKDDPSIAIENIHGSGYRLIINT